MQKKSDKNIFEVTTKKNKNSNGVWAAFDRIACINLVERPDRYKKVLAEFTKVELAETVEFHKPVRDPRGGKWGCYQSHHNIIKKAYKDANVKYEL